MTEAELLAAGYKPYRQGCRPNTRLLQKCIRNERQDKLYFIDVDVYDDLIKYGSCGLAPRVQFVQNRDAPNERTFNVDLLVHSETVEAMEAFYAKCYAVFGCDPYEQARA